MLCIVKLSNCCLQYYINWCERYTFVENSIDVRVRHGQTIDDDKEFTEEELAEFERQVREQPKHNVAQEHAQPGEVNVRTQPTS